MKFNINNMRKNASAKVVIISSPLSNKDFMEYHNTDDILVYHINIKKTELISNNIEIFKQVDNIIITEKGVYIAAFFDDLKKAAILDKIKQIHNK